MLSGISMVLAPDIFQQFFSLVVYASAEKIATFGESAVAYITLVHGILGAVMFGWSVALMYVIFGSFRRGYWDGWLTLTVSISAWFLPDTVFSIWSGFWQNAILNLVFTVLFAIPLIATFRDFRERRL